MNYDTVSRELKVGITKNIPARVLMCLFKVEVQLRKIEEKNSSSILQTLFCRPVFDNFV